MLAGRDRTKRGVIHLLRAAVAGMGTTTIMAVIAVVIRVLYMEATDLKGEGPWEGRGGGDWFSLTLDQAFC